jgi:hypothetical protein
MPRVRSGATPSDFSCALVRPCALLFPPAAGVRVPDSRQSWQAGGRIPREAGYYATPMPAASSREMACSVLPTRTVKGPPKGSALRSFTLLPGTSASFAR